MKKKLIAITLSFENKFNKELLKCWAILKDQHKIKYISSRSERPHIALLSGYVNDLDKFIKALKKINTRKFYLKTRGLGLFFNEKPLLYIRWEQNIDIIRLYQVFDKKLNFFFINNNMYSKFSSWVPKTTLAYRDLEFKDLSKIEKKLKFINKKNKVLIKQIDVMVVDQKKGEEIIFTKSL